MIHLNRTPILLAALASFLLQSGCGGGGGGGASAPTTSPTPTVATFTVGGTVSGMFGSGLVLQNNAGDDVTVNANGNFLFATTLAAPSAYAVSIKTQPTLPAQTCTLAAGSGAIAASNVTNVTVSCTLALSAPKFAYVANAGDPSITSFTINASTGALTAIPLTLAESQLPGTQPVSLAIDLSNKFLYAADVTNHNVLAFTLNPTTGKHTAVAGGIYATGGRLPNSVAIDPTGKYVYVANQQDGAGGTIGNVSVFAVNPGTGALTAVPGSPFSAGLTTTAVAVDPKGKFVYAANLGNPAILGTISAFTVNAATGALTPVAGSPFAFGLSPRTLAVDPSGRTLAITGTGAAMQSYNINQSTGALTNQAINGPGFALGLSIAFDPTGQFAYSASFGGNSVQTLNFNAAAQPTGGGAAIISAGGPTQVVADPSGKFIYVSNGAGGVGTISGFSINPTTGNLAVLPSSPTTAGLVPRAIALTR